MFSYTKYLGDIGGWVAITAVGCRVEDDLI